VLSSRVLGTTSEKFVLAIVLLDAFLHGQGHYLPSTQVMAGPLYGLERSKRGRTLGLG
jgi:hypothetical protein